MKVATTLVVLGVTGLALYAYAQLTSLSSKFVGWAISSSAGPDYPGGATPIYVRNWTVGLVWAAVGGVLLGIGVYRLLRYRKA